MSQRVHRLLLDIGGSAAGDGHGDKHGDDRDTHDPQATPGAGRRPRHLTWSAPGGLQALGAFTKIQPPLLPLAFNVCVSNVPGPREPLYLRGSRMEAYYPASIPIHGMALNITVLSYAGTLNAGFIGDRDALPHLQRLAVYTGEALDELDAALPSSVPR